MTIQIQGKGQGGFAPWQIITGLSPDKEAALMQGGGAVLLGPDDVTLVTAKRDLVHQHASCET